MEQVLKELAEIKKKLCHIEDTIGGEVSNVAALLEDLMDDDFEDEDSASDDDEYGGCDEPIGVTGAKAKEQSGSINRSVSTNLKRKCVIPKSSDSKVTTALKSNAGSSQGTVSTTQTTQAQDTIPTVTTKSNLSGKNTPSQGVK